MQSESNPYVPAPLTPLPSAAKKSAWGRVGYLAVTLAGLAIIGVGFYFFPPVARNGNAVEPGGESPKSPSTLEVTPGRFNGWVKPDLVIVVTGQMHGYIQPCGCSSPQYGGLARRYNFIESLKAKGWPVVALDVGEIPQTHGPQAMLKYVTSIRALKLMGYSAIGLGKQEFNMPLFEGLARTSLNDPLPTPIGTNLEKTKKGQENYDLNVREYKVIDTVSPRLGIFSVADKNIVDQVQAGAGVKFIMPAAQPLAAALKEARANKAEVNVLLYQGTEAKDEIGKLLADLNAIRANDKKVPILPIVLCLSNESEPPGKEKNMNGTQVVTVGHKGRYVGVIGLFKQKNAYQFRYELVAIGPEFDLPEGKRNPVMDLMEQYALEVKEKNYLDRYPRSQHHNQVQFAAIGVESKYVGSEKCANCHEHAYDVWKNPKPGEKKYHAMAFKSLSEAKHPILRQFDGECVACHTVGWSATVGSDNRPSFIRNIGGYGDKGNTDKLNKLLEHVGCESCHGPASAHVNNPQDAKIKRIINPLTTNLKHLPPENVGNKALIQQWVSSQRLKQDGFCQKCHDSENDVHWGDLPYLEKWRKIEHMTPPIAGVNANKGGPAVEKGPPVIRIDTEEKK